MHCIQWSFTQSRPTPRSVEPVPLPVMFFLTRHPSTKIKYRYNKTCKVGWAMEVRGQSEWSRSLCGLCFCRSLLPFHFTNQMVYAGSLLARSGQSDWSRLWCCSYLPRSFLSFQCCLLALWEGGSLTTAGSDVASASFPHSLLPSHKVDGIH